MCEYECWEKIVPVYDVADLVSVALQRDSEGSAQSQIRDLKNAFCLVH